MAEKYVEKPIVKPEERLLPAIKRAPAELHSEVDVLARAAEHLNTPTDATYTDVRTADLRMKVAMNAQPFISAGAVSLQERFKRVLDAVERA